MVVSCLNNKYDKQVLVLPTQEDKTVQFDDLIIVGGWYSIFKEQIGYSTTIAQQYTVYGILQYDSQLYYLIQDDDNLAVFVPHSLMKICDNAIPFDWSINSFELEKGSLFIIGYNELTISYKSMCNLINQESTAVRNFLEYKAHIEHWQ